MIDPGELFMLGAFMKIKKISKVNPVAKASRNKSGAGAHKSKKDYDRKAGKEELIDLLRQQQEITKGMEWVRLEEEIQELLDAEDEDGK